MPRRGEFKGNHIKVSGNIAEIYLASGKIAIIDAEDYDLVKPFTWVNGPWRVYSMVRFKGQYGVKAIEYAVGLHRLVLLNEYHCIDDRVVDHINHNIFDNRKINLRVATYSENQFNAIPRKGGTSKYKGVTWNKSRRKWQVAIDFRKEHFYLGLYDNEIEAALAYNVAAVKYYKEFAFINQIQISALPDPGSVLNDQLLVSESQEDMGARVMNKVFAEYDRETGYDG